MSSGLRIEGVLLTLAALLLIVAVRGCDGGPNFAFDPPADFRAATDGLCVKQAEAAAKTQLDLGQPRGAAQAAADQRAIGESVATFDAQFVALKPPVALAADYSTYLGSRSDVGDLMGRYSGTLEGGRTGAIIAARRSLDAGRDGQWQAAAALGLQDCSEQLGVGTEHQVADVVERIDTSSDPAKVCKGLVFDSYVESSFGGFEACKRFQRKASNTAKSIDVERVTGVDGVSATVDFRDVAGPFDGRPLRASLFYADGRWRLWNVVELTS